MPGMASGPRRWSLETSCAAMIATMAAVAAASPDAAGAAQLVGTWRGTSVCPDRVAAPACKDEVVVYECTTGSRPGEVHWAADKVVNGERGRMGELELAYAEAEGCWKAEFESPRAHGVWCLKVDGTHLTGTLRLLPGKETVRKVDARKD